MNKTAIISGTTFVLAWVTGLLIAAAAPPRTPVPPTSPPTSPRTSTPRWPSTSSSTPSPALP